MSGRNGWDIIMIICLLFSNGKCLWDFPIGNCCRNFLFENVFILIFYIMEKSCEVGILISLEYNIYSYLDFFDSASN